MPNKNFGERRGFQRVLTPLSAVIHDDRGRKYFAMVPNVTAGGVCLKIQGDIPKVEGFWVKIHGVGKFRAYVRWNTGNFLGIRFKEDPAEVAEKFRGYIEPA